MRKVTIMISSKLQQGPPTWHSCLPSAYACKDGASGLAAVYDPLTSSVFPEAWLGAFEIVAFPGPEVVKI